VADRFVSDRTEIRHASSVALDGRGILIEGASGAGKSTLALELMMLGGVLVADDRTIVRLGRKGLYLSAPEPIRGVIEARGVGLLSAPFADESGLSLLVELGKPAEGRLPDRQYRSIMGVRIELVRSATVDRLAPKLVHLMRYGRAEI